MKSPLNLAFIATFYSNLKPSSPTSMYDEHGTFSPVRIKMFIKFEKKKKIYPPAELVRIYKRD